MFAAFIEKVREAFGGNSVSEGHVVADNATVVDHDSDSAATISAASNAWEKAAEKVAYIKDCTQSVQLGSTAYCTKGAEGQDAANDLIGTSFEATTEDVIWSDDDLISSGTDDTKFVIRGGLKGISDTTSGDLPSYSKIEHVRHSFAQQHKDMERADAETGVRTK